MTEVFTNTQAYSPQDGTNEAQYNEYQPTLNLAPASDEVKKLSMSGPAIPDTVKPSVLDQRVMKYDYGLNEESPGADILRQDIVLAGGEERLRQYAADKQNVRTQGMKLDLLTQYANNLPPGQNADPQIADDIMRMTPADLADPQTFLEKRYASRMISDVAHLDMTEPVEIAGSIVDDSTLSAALFEDPNTALDMMDGAQEVKTRQEIALRKLEDADARWSKLGLPNKIWNAGEMAVPFLSWYRMSNLLDQKGPTLLGENLKDTYKRLNLMPVEAAKRETDRIFDTLWASNPYDAYQFAQGLVSYQGSDEAWGNITSYVDVSTILPVGATLRATKALGRGLKGAVGATKGLITNPTLAAEGSGNTARASLAAAKKILEDRAQAAAATRPGSAKDLLFQVPAISNPWKWIGQDMGHFTREAGQRIADMMGSGTAKYIQAVFDDAVSVARIAPDSEEAQVAKSTLADMMNVTYGKGSDVVIDVDLKDPLEGLGSAQFLSIKLGRKNAELFDTVEQAKAMADDWYGLTKYDVRPQGSKYFIEITKPLDETNPNIFDKLKEVTKGKTPSTIAATALHWFKSGRYLINQDYYSKILRGTVAGQALLDIGRNMWKEIGTLSRGEYDDFQRFLNHQNAYFNPATKQRGKFSEGLWEFERDWMRKFNKLPTEKQARAYFMSRTLNDLEYVTRNIALYRDKIRKGMELWDFIPLSKGTPSIEGIQRKTSYLWENEADASVMVVDEEGLRIGRKKYMPADRDPDNPSKLSRKEINELIATGNYKLVEITPVGHQKLIDTFAGDPLIDGLKSRVNFVLAKTARSGPLPFKQIPYQPGGHIAMREGWYMRQPKLKFDTAKGSRITNYFGDQNAFFHLVEKDGVEATKRVNVIRLLWSKGANKSLPTAERDAARAELIKKIKDGYLPLSLREVARMFGGKNPKFDYKVPFYLTRHNENVEDAVKLSDMRAEYPNFHNEETSPYNAYAGGIGLQWTGERHGPLLTMTRGGYDTPFFNLEKAPLIDADITLERAMDSALRGVYYDDIKHTMATNFVTEFGDLLQNDAMLSRISPLSTLQNAIFKEGADPILVRAAKNHRRALLQFIGAKSPWEQYVSNVEVKLQQSLYGTLGVKGTEKLNDAIEFADSWSYGLIKDPTRALRRMASSFKLGLFNPVQMMKQGMTFTHAIALAGPKIGGQAMWMSWFQRAAMMAPQHLDAFAAKTGMNAAHFKESFDMAIKMGWYRVGKEYASIDDIAYPGLRQTRLGKVDDWGRAFFREGERFPRMVGWNAAYLEWRIANPTSKFTNAVGESLLRRADDMSVNMIQAANAQWQKGWTALPSQFWSYQARLFEQFWSKAFTKGERAEAVRMLATYSALYGLPVGAGVPLGLVDVPTSVREYFTANHINVDDNIVVKTMVDGTISMMAELAAGEKTNISEQVGPNGLPFLRDLDDALHGQRDMSIPELLGGVSVKTFSDIVGTMEPLTRVLTSGLGEDEQSLFEFSSEDILDVFRNASAYKIYENAWNGIAVGKFFSKHEEILDKDVGTVDVILKLLFGAEPYDISKAYAQASVRGDIEKYVFKRVQEASKEYMRAFRSDNVEDQLRYFKRAEAILRTTDNIQHADRSRAISMALDKVGISKIEKEGEKWRQLGPDYLNDILNAVNNRKIKK